MHERKRSSEPHGAEQEIFMLRTKSAPSGHMEEEKKPSKNECNEEHRRSESNMQKEVDRKNWWRLRRRMDGEKGRRNSTTTVVAKDRDGGQVDRETLRRRSEPCSILHLQLLPLSSGRRRALSQQTNTEPQRSFNKDGSENRSPLEKSKRTAGTTVALQQPPKRM